MSTAIGWAYYLALLVLPPMVWFVVWRSSRLVARERPDVRAVLALATLSGGVAMSGAITALVLSPATPWETVLGTIAGTALLIQTSPFTAPFLLDEVAKLLKTLDARERRDRLEGFDFDSAWEAATADPGVQRGDIFQLGDHRLMCGDSAATGDVARLMAGETARLMVTDPPYGVAYEPEGRKRKRPIANDALGEGQAEFWTKAFAACPLDGDAYVFSPSGPLIQTLCASIVAAGIEHHQWLIWVKDRLVLGHSHYHYRHEHVFYGWKGKTSWQGSRKEDSVWEEDRPQSSPQHPTMKPVELCVRAIENSSKPDDVVAEPFLGSGTTLIAAERTGRRCYGMEIDPRYCRVAIARWEAFTGMAAEKVKA